MGLFRKKRARERAYCSAVVVAAGASTRMGEDKILLELEGDG